MDRIEPTSARERLTITAVCPACGTVEVPARNIHLWMDGAAHSRYSFICSGCSEFVRAPADHGTVGLLLAAAPPLAHDDVRRFKTALDRDDWFHRVERISPAPGSPVRKRPAGRLASLIASFRSGRHRMLSS